MSADNLIDQFQDDCVGRLKCCALFTPVQIVEERLGTTIDEVQKAIIGGKSTAGLQPGLGIIVRMPSWKPKVAQAGPQYWIRAEIWTYEYARINYSSNGTKISSRRASMQIDQLFHQWCLGPRAITIETVQPWNDGEGFQGFKHTLEWQAGQARPVQCTAPLISLAGTTATLINNEAGSALYYTTDASFPGPSNPAAVLYSAPFTAASGTLLRAAAYLVNKNSSDIPETTIP